MKKIILICVVSLIYCGSLFADTETISDIDFAIKEAQYISNRLNIICGTDSNYPFLRLMAEKLAERLVKIKSDKEDIEFEKEAYKEAINTAVDKYLDDVESLIKGEKDLEDIRRLRLQIIGNGL